MSSFILRRFIALVITLLAVSVLVFTLSRVSGDPRELYLGEFTTDEQWDAWGRQMGLDKPFIVQYLVWLGNATTGDLGNSLREQRPVTDILVEKLPATLQLGLAAFVFSVVLGVLLGVLAAVKRGTMWDYLGRTFAILGQATPPFWLGIMLILVFAVHFNWLPSGRRVGLNSLILPTITLGWLAVAANLRLVRSSMLEVLDSEYIKLARAKGVSAAGVVWRHAFRNALVPPLTQAGLTLASFIAGAVVTETVFAWPGMGRLAVEAVNQNDFPLLVGAVLTISFLYVAMNFLVDISYGLIDPRIRYS
jgi:peptide/nickel transport system permease protein